MINKKKLFISQRMHGLTDEECLAQRDIAYEKAKIKLQELGENPDDYELIDQFNLSTAALKLHQCESPIDGERARAFMLGNSIKLMAEADYVYFHGDWRGSTGAVLEYQICAMYHIPILYAGGFNGTHIFD